VPTIIDQGSNSNFTRSQAWYDLVAAVDPNNADRLYIGGVDALRSDDGGSTWNQITTWSLFAATGFTSAQNVHADHHAIVFAPGSSSRAIWGTDGGVDYTTDADIPAPSKPTFVDKNNGYNVTQYYACAIHPTLTNYFLAGAQDNGTQKFTMAGVNATINASGGDGAFCHIDQDNPNIQITSYVFNNYYISTNGGTSFSSRFFLNNNGGFINPTDYDDANNKLYGGSSLGKYFRWNDAGVGGTSWDTVGCTAFGSASVRHVLVSKTVANRVYFGLSNGSVVMVNDAHSGTSVNGTVLRSGTGSVSGIAIDPANEAHMLVTYSNYGVTSVWESFNATSTSPTWTAVEGNLPDMPVRWVMFDPRNNDWALIATELGVWSTDNLNGASTD
jgi:trimeric autotransporter adhesin